MSPALTTAFRSGMQAARDVMLPGFILLILAAILAYLYYFQPEIQSFFDIYGSWRIQYGVLVSMAFLAFCGGVLPWIFQMLIPHLRPAHPWSGLIFLTLYWGCIGFCNDSMYTLQSYMFGSENSIRIVVKKVLVDQFVYSLIFAAPVNGIAYYLKDVNFSLKLLKESFRSGWFLRVVLPVYIMGLTIWIPGTSIIYYMPFELQIFMASIIGCFYSLICTYVTSHARENNAVKSRVEDK